MSMITKIEKKIIYNDVNIGQCKSIDKAYELVDTEYIFHCEDDWEFTSPNFIINLLNGKQPTIFGDGSKKRDFVYVDDVNNFHLIKCWFYFCTFI